MAALSGHASGVGHLVEIHRQETIAGVIVIRIARSEQGRWNVLESDFEDPLAAFDDRESACDYANKLSLGTDAATVVLLDEDMHSGSLGGGKPKEGLHQPSRRH